RRRATPSDARCSAAWISASAHRCPRRDSRCSWPGAAPSRTAYGELLQGCVVSGRRGVSRPWADVFSGHRAPAAVFGAALLLFGFASPAHAQAPGRRAVPEMMAVARTHASYGSGVADGILAQRDSVYAR